MTDDRGIYRAYGLQPGVYIVSIDSGDGLQPSARHYPSATRDTATEINVRSGEEVSGVDIPSRRPRTHCQRLGLRRTRILVVIQPSSGHVEGGEDGRFEDRTWTTNTGGLRSGGVRRRLRIDRDASSNDGRNVRLGQAASIGEGDVSGLSCWRRVRSPVAS